MNSEKIRRWFEREKGKEQQIRKMIKRTNHDIEKIESEIEVSQQAQSVIHDVAIKTQKSIKLHLSELVTMALHSVLDDVYDMDLEFTSKRGKVEVQFFLTKNGNSCDPIFGTGGGVSDVASMGLKLSVFTLTNGKVRPLMLLDEPLHWLKGGSMPQKGSEMLKTIPNKLGIQTIIVSHDAELIQSADNIIEIKKEKGESIHAKS